MNICFENKKILVTGAGSGIGYQVAVAFTKSGAEKVFALSKSQSKLDKVATESPVITTICVDLADWDATKKALQGLGPIDVLVNNAGVSFIEPFLEVKPEHFDSSFDINVKATINVSQVIAASMIENKLAGAIVNVSSQASQIALWNHTVYGATKAAVDSLTRAMALELGEYNIRVNAVNPTVVWTDMGKKAWSDPKKSKPLLDRIPLHRFAEVKDVVHAILYLASDKADMITGSTLPIEGGMLISASVRSTKTVWEGTEKARVMLNQTPLKRFAEIEDIVHTVLYLAGYKAGIVTGNAVPVEGGYIY